jgi:hypothetical protein
MLDQEVQVEAEEVLPILLPNLEEQPILHPFHKVQMEEQANILQDHLRVAVAAVELEVLEEILVQLVLVLVVPAELV